MAAPSKISHSAQTHLCCMRTDKATVQSLQIEHYLHIFRQLCVPFKTVITYLPWPLLCVTSHMLTMFTNTASDMTVMFNMVG